MADQSEAHNQAQQAADPAAKPKQKGVPADPSGWAERLGEVGLPVFAGTVRDVSQVALSTASSAADLSEVVGQDAAMAARLLRIANSAVFNPQGNQIDTLSAAVVMIGFDSIREIAVSVAVVEQLLKGNETLTQRLAGGLARAFHAAAQAKGIAVLREDPCPEEVFVAALLRNVGELAFWSSVAKDKTVARVAEQIEARVAAGDALAAAARTALGFDLTELNQSVAQQWGLGELVCRAVNPKHSDDRTALVAAGHRIAAAVEAQGWEGAQLQEALAQLAQDEAEAGTMKELVRTGIEHAQQVAGNYGLKSLVAPVAKPTTAPQKSTSAVTKREVAQAAVQADQAIAPDRDGSLDELAQLDALEDIAQALEGGAGRDELMQRLVDGALTSFAGRSSYFALFTPDRRSLLMKYAAGPDGEKLIGSKRPIGGTKDGLGQAIVEGKATTMVGDDSPWLGAAHAAIVPVKVQQKVIGLLCLQTDSPLDARWIGRLRHFGQQAVLILTQASAK